MEAILRSFLKSHLSSYISSSEDDGAGLSFKGVELRAEEYPRVERFSARSLEILVPWAALARQSIEVHFRGVDLALGRLSTTGDKTGQRGTETRQEMDGDDLIASTRGRPWDEGELSGSEWREGEPGAAESGEVGGASWVGMSIRSRLIRSGLNVSLFVEDLTFTEDLGANKAIVHVASLSVVNIPAEDWEELVRNPDGWLGKAVIMEDVHVSIGESRMHVGSLHLSSVLPLYEFLAEDFDYTGEGDRVVPVSVNVSTIGLDGPRPGTLVGWLLNKMAGEEKESPWSVDVGVTVGELTYQEHGLTRVVVLWRDGVTALRVERLGVNFGIGWGVCSADNVAVRIEDGVAQMDEITLVGRVASILASGIEVGWSDGVRVGVRSVSCTVVVDNAMGDFSAELVRGESGEEGAVLKQDDPTGGEPSSSGEDTATGDATLWSMEVGMIVLGLQVGDNVVSIWSSGLHLDAGRFGAVCAGVDVDCERLVGIRGAIEAVNGNPPRVSLGDVDIWLVKEYLGPIGRCWDLWKAMNSTRGAQAGEEDGASPVATTTVELGSLTMHLGEREGVWAQQVTIVDTRDFTRAPLQGEGDKFLESIAFELEDGYSLYEDREEQGLWYIARPVSFRSLLKTVLVNGKELARNTEVQLNVGPGGGRLELNVEGRTLVLGVPGWGAAEESGKEDWTTADVLLPRPGTATHVDLGDGLECVLSTRLTSYCRLDVLLAPKVLLRCQLSCECIVEILGKQSGAVVLDAGMEIGVDAETTSMFVVVVRKDGVEYRTLPLSFAMGGELFVKMRPVDRHHKDGIDPTDAMKIAVAIEHKVDGYAQVCIRSCGENPDDLPTEETIVGRTSPTKTPMPRPQGHQGIGVKDRYHDLIDNGDVLQTASLRSSDAPGGNSDRSPHSPPAAHEVNLPAHDAITSPMCASHAEENIDRICDGNQEPTARGLGLNLASPRSRWLAENGDLLGDDAVDPNPPVTSNIVSRPGPSSIHEEHEGQAFSASNPWTSARSTKFSHLYAFLSAHDRFNAVFRFERLALVWNSDVSDQGILTKFANLVVLSGPQQSILTVGPACSIASTVGSLKLDLPSVSLPVVDQRVFDCLTVFRALMSAVLAEDGDDEPAAERDDGSKVGQQSPARSLVTGSTVVTCGGVKLYGMSLPSIRVDVTSAEFGSGMEFVDHVRKCALRTLPSLVLDILRGLAL